MATNERLYEAGTRRAERTLRDLGDEFRAARLQFGLSQRQVAEAARVHRSSYTRIEAGKLRSLTFLVGARIGAVLGLDVSAKAFRGGRSIRDAGQGPRLAKLVQCIARPLHYRVDVPLPAVAGRFEQRAWDLVILGYSKRTAIEFEARLYDIQAQVRRWLLKWRDDPVDHLLIVIADTRTNRRVVEEFADLLVNFPRLRTETVLEQLRTGQHPPTGLILVSAPVPRSNRQRSGDRGSPLKRLQG